MLKGLFIFIFTFFYVILLAQKTDVIILKNGDNITGEIKKLDMDILQLKTSTMSTVQIKWFQVSTIHAPDKYCQIELKDKTLIYGNIDSTDIPNAIRLISEMGEFNIPTSQIVTIYQVKKVFWNRFSGNMGAGLNYTKGSEVLQTNSNIYLAYKDEYNIFTLNYSSIRTDQPEVSNTIQENGSISYKRIVLPRHYTSVFAGTQVNTELGIARRMLGGAGYGYDLIHSTISRLRIIGGAMITTENTIEDDLTTINGEGVLGMEAQVFKYTDPEVYLTSSINWYPSMTIPGRNRMELDIKIRVEVLNNFYVEVKFYDNFDSKPASESASNNDYGFISSVQYTFGL